MLNQSINQSITDTDTSPNVCSLHSSVHHSLVTMLSRQPLHTWLSQMVCPASWQWHHCEHSAVA